MAELSNFGVPLSARIAAVETAEMAMDETAAIAHHDAVAPAKAAPAAVAVVLMANPVTAFAIAAEIGSRGTLSHELGFLRTLKGMSFFMWNPCAVCIDCVDCDHTLFIQENTPRTD